MRTDLEIEITSRVQKLLALDPTIGPLARDRLSSFRRDADCISHACLIAAFDLPSGPEKRGAKAKDWYQSFTALLLTVAGNTGISPTLHKNRKANQPAGWLLRAAGEFETFLPREMRSPSDVARYKRLERSKVSPRKARRQNSRAG